MRIFLLVAALLVVVPDAAPAQSSPDGFDLQGHRGARGLAPENTIPACRRALDLGVTTLEMDVVISGDGQVVVSHEPWMNHKICSLPSGAPVPENVGREHNLYRMPYAEIEEYDCGRRQHPDFPRQATQPAVKPLLHDVIAMAEAYVAEHDRPPVFYNIEIKSRPDWDGTFHPEPEAFAPILATSLNNLANVVSALGRPEEALGFAEEAVRTLAPFFLSRPAAFAAPIATMGGVYVRACAAAGREPDAELLVPIAEKLREIWRSGARGLRARLDRQARGPGGTGR